jgi:23S rRNA (uridine2552-2'-O)-methyltransferase
MKSPSKRGKVDRAWLNDHLNDPYVKKAQGEGYRARAAYKLLEIDAQHRLVRPGAAVVELGSAPGAWSQYLSRTLAGQGLVVALDLLPMEPVLGVHFIQGDFREEETLQRLQATLSSHGVQGLDAVLSDMAPNLSGVAVADAARMAHLVELAVAFAQAHLKPEGALLVKLFHGSGYSQLVRLFKDHFVQVKPLKPKASRARSAETFLLGRGLKLPTLAQQQA